MEIINKNQTYQVNIFYSTPEQYIKKVNEYALKNSIGFQDRTQDDIYPYYEKLFSIWTGYFTSRPNLKAKIRNSGKLLQSIEKMLAVFQIEEIIGQSKIVKQKIKLDIQHCRKELTIAVAIGQHHDAVTGTSTEAVTNDYIQIINKAEQICQQTMNSLFNEKFFEYLETSNIITMCSLNSTLCELQTGAHDFLLIVFNPSEESKKFVKLKGKQSKEIKIYNTDGEQLQGQKICGWLGNQECEFYFEVNISPMKLSQFLVKINEQTDIQIQTQIIPVVFEEEIITINQQKEEEEEESTHNFRNLQDQSFLPQQLKPQQEQSQQQQQPQQQQQQIPQPKPEAVAPIKSLSEEILQQALEEDDDNSDEEESEFEKQLKEMLKRDLEENGLDDEKRAREIKRVSEQSKKIKKDDNNKNKEKQEESGETSQKPKDPLSILRNRFPDLTEEQLKKKLKNKRKNERRKEKKKTL
eukprot:TRINITY_DN486_c0_g1_i2.p1 TRINITY_DN486_c0_g1~~TRINITY_DN486_c0_g1_i2.p1  ORF type:complete len:467 (-),score=126.55 TRINITY_DN486_c0_g1_i2:1366-2766(-)